MILAGEISQVWIEEVRPVKKVVLLRHGESEWNKENRFTGWTDVALNENGVREAVEAGRTLRREGVCLRHGLHVGAEKGN